MLIAIEEGEFSICGKPRGIGVTCATLLLSGRANTRCLVDLILAVFIGNRGQVALHSPRLIAKRLDDLGRRRLQIGQMIPRHVADRTSGLGPDNIDNSVDPSTIQERHSHAGQPIWSLPSIGATAKRRVADAISIRACLGQDLIETFGIARKPVFWLVRLSKHSKDFLALILWAISEIGSSDGRQHPIDRSADPFMHEKDCEWSAHTA